MNRNRILSAALAAILALSLSPGALAAAEESAPVAVLLNGTELGFGGFAPEIDAKTGRTFLPFRQVFEALGCAPGDITWDQETQTAAAVRGDTTVTLTTGALTARVTVGDGPTRTEVMDAAPYLRTDENGGGYVYVPVRFAAQALGCEVGWDEEARAVLLTDSYGLPENLSPTLPQEESSWDISFRQLGKLVRTRSPLVLSMEEGAASLKAFDYDEVHEDTLEGISQIVSAQFFASGGQFTSPITGQTITVPQDSYAVSTLEREYQSAKAYLKDLEEGKIQKNLSDAILQIRNGQDIIVKSAEALYVGILELEAVISAMRRSLSALDRTLTTMEKQYELGRISLLNLNQVKAGRTSTESQLATCEMNLSTMKLQLEQLIGAEPTGTISLAPLPRITEATIGGMDPDADLEAAKSASYDLYAAKLTLEDEKKHWKDNNGRIYNPDSVPGSLSGSYTVVQAHHTWLAAQYTYENTILDFETRFRILSLQVKDYAQVLAASEAALDLELEEYAAEQAKYALGNLSENALSDAFDEVQSAQDSVAAARRNLFSAWNNYRWAVDYGILN